jgi:hypothetical protein
MNKETRTMALLPWLNLGGEFTIDRFTFSPVLNDDGTIHPVLRGVQAELLEFLKFYVDQQGQPTRRAAFAFETGAGCGFSGEDIQQLGRLTALSFLACVG